MNENEIEREFQDLERRLAEQNPGVQAVLDTYALVQPATQRFDETLRVINPMPRVVTSNGSA